MKIIGVTFYGFEDLLINEIKRVLDVKAKTASKGRVIFDVENIGDLDKLRLVKTTYSLMDEFKFEKISEVYTRIEKLDFNDIKESFVVRCYREGEHKFGSGTVERKIGEIIYDKGFKVDLKNPEKTIFVEIVDDRFFIGYLIKNDICKRYYRLRINSNSINGCLAAGMIDLADCKKSDLILDPFCRDGVICIEAGLKGFRNVYGTDDNLNNIKNAKINSGLAKTNVNFFDSGLKGLDVKFGKEKVDFVITRLISVSNRISDGIVDKIYSDFFYNVKYVVKKNGKIVLCCDKIELLNKKIEENGLEILEKMEVFVGGQNYFLVVLKP